MIVRIAVAVLAFLVAHQLERAIGDDLVGVHVRRRARAALEDIELELIVKFPVDHFPAGALDASKDGLVELSALVVRARGGDLTIASALMKSG